MKTNYEKIVAIIKSGHLAIGEIIGENHKYRIFTKKLENSIKTTYGSNNIDTCLEENDHIWWNKETINNIKFKTIKPYYKKINMLEPGDMVQIGFIARKCEDYKNWSKEKKDMVGRGPFKIKKTTYGSCGIRYNLYSKSGNAYQFPANAVCLYIGDEKEDILEIGGVKYSKTEIEKALKNIKPLTK